MSFKSLNYINIIIDCVILLLVVCMNTLIHFSDRNYTQLRAFCGNRYAVKVIFTSVLNLQADKQMRSLYISFLNHLFIIRTAVYILTLSQGNT